MRGTLQEGPEDWVCDTIEPVQCHACESFPVEELSLEALNTKYPPNIRITIGRRDIRLCEYHAKALISMLQNELNAEFTRRRNAFKHECPVCGQHNEREVYYEDGIGVVEEHYFCDNCGFAEEMAYSPSFTTFVKGGKLKDRLRRLFIRIRNWKKALVVRLNDSFDVKLGKYI